MFQFHGTDKPGVYQVRQGDAVIQRFAVNLFDRAESDIGVRPSQDPESPTVRPADIRIGHVDVAATTDRAPSRQETWKMLLCVCPVRPGAGMVYLQPTGISLIRLPWHGMLLEFGDTEGSFS